MHITGMEIYDIPPFTEPVELEFDQRVNVFIGPNGTGKSVAVRTLQKRVPLESRFDFCLSDDWAQMLNDESLVRQMQRGVNFRDDMKPGANFLPWTYIPAGRINLPLSLDTVEMSSLQAQGVQVVVVEDEIEDAMGSPRPINLSHLLRDSLYAFDSRVVHNVYKTLANRINMQRVTDDDANLYDSVDKVASACVQTICSEILPAGTVAFDYVHQQMVGRRSVPMTNVHNKMNIPTTDTNVSGLFAGDLSSGTQGTLMWVWYLALKMAEFYQRHRYVIGRTNMDWHSAPSILVIDEIENNLHPTWQRRVIPALKHHFPKLQIFATTHSPFVVAGLEAGQVHQLIRDSNGLITAETNTEPIKGLTTDEISRKYLEVQDPTDLATAEAAAELRALRDEGPRDTEDAEAARQERMQELRQLVDRDLLAGGPAAAQRELFEQQFAEALEKYQRSRDLGQDNG